MAVTNVIETENKKIYLLEIFIERLNLLADRVALLAGIAKLFIYIRLMDFSPLKICVRNLQLSNNCIPINAGRTCIFMEIPENVANASINYLTIDIQIFKCSNKTVNSASVEKSLLCKTKNPLPCYLIDDTDRVKSGIISYHLIDKRQKSVGCITVMLRLSGLGNSILTDFKFTLRNSTRCKKLHCIEELNTVRMTTELDDGASPPKYAKKLFDDNLVSHIVASRLKMQCESDALRLSELPLRISIDQLGLENLTRAEKLNDSQYRDLVYRSYPDKPACSCPRSSGSGHRMICSSGCKGSCCTRDSNSVRWSSVDASFCCRDIERYPSGDRNDTDKSNVLRIRGGGSSGDLCLVRSTNCWFDFDNEYKYYGDADFVRFHQSRLAGGGEACVCSRSPTSHRWNTTIENSRCLNEERIVSPGVLCLQKPHPEIDCLIRAFQDAQDFVDSIGKVPGLVGLGLMDPSESPYFGRKHNREYSPLKSARIRAVKDGKTNFTVPCNSITTNQGTTGDIGVEFTDTFHGRTGKGIVREVVPHAETSKYNSRFETIDVPTKLETGPCGNVICKSRLVKSADEQNKKNGEIGQKSRYTRKEMGRDSRNKIRAKNEKTKERREIDKDDKAENGKARGNRKEKKNRNQGKTNTKLDFEMPTKSLMQKRKKFESRFGAAGDFDTNASNFPIKVSKQVMKFIYTIGDYYPGLVYGHRSCIDPRLKVPANMGWRWDTISIIGIKPRIGWKPGAIPKTIYQQMQAVKHEFYERLEQEKKEEAATNLRRNEEARQRRISRHRSKTRRLNVKTSSKTKKNARQMGSGSKSPTKGKNKASNVKVTSRKNVSGQKLKRLAGGASDTDLFSTDTNESTTESIIDPIRKKIKPVRLAGGGWPDRQPSLARSSRLEGGASKSSKAITSLSKSKKQSKLQFKRSLASLKKDGQDGQEEENPPTLRIQRKDGTYYVTMHPIRPETSENRIDEPIKPLHFKIARNKDKEDGVSSSSTASDIEIEFSPPAAMSKRQKKPDVIHTSTQVKQHEIIEAMGLKKDKRKRRQHTMCR